MQGLIGRLGTLDPDATETLKVVTYFDALLTAGLGVKALLRAAAAMTGTVVGGRTRARSLRIDAQGKRLDDTAKAASAITATIEGGEVWIERSGSPHVNDDMVLERLALAVVFSERREPPARRALDVALDPSRSTGEREHALARIGLSPATTIRVVVGPLSSGVPQAGATAALTSRGPVSILVLSAGAEADFFPRGTGLPARADAMWTSYRTAELAYRLTDDKRPSVDALELGLLLPAVDALLDGAPEHPDVLTLSRLDQRHREVLDALVAADSVRAAATVLHLHHSTVQAKHVWLTRRLGYDPRSPLGRLRYQLASLALRLGALGQA